MAPVECRPEVMTVCTASKYSVPTKAWWRVAR
jgi:hypothetical protein